MKQEHTPDARKVYADIIDLPHWQSPTRPHMSLYERSAQFSAYKALTGYEDMVKEEARLTEHAIELDESELGLLDQQLHRISEDLENGIHPSVTFTIFIPDEKKAGGSYATVNDIVKWIDMSARRFILMGTEGYSHTKRALSFDQIIAIHTVDNI